MSLQYFVLIFLKTSCFVFVGISLMGCEGSFRTNELVISKPHTQTETSVFYPTSDPAPSPTPSMPLRISQVLKLGNSILIGEQGQSIMLALRFDSAPLSSNYSVFIHFVSENGSQYSLGDHAPVIPTSTWNGNVSYSYSGTVPTSVPVGNYTVRIGLFSGNDRYPLTPGPGVIQDDEHRYTVGTIRVYASTPTPSPAPAPNPIPLPVPTGSCRAMRPLNLGSLTPSANLHIDGQDGTVIDGRAFTFSGGQNCLYITNSRNITVRNSSFIGCYRGVMTENSSNIIIEDNYFQANVAGAAAWTSTNVKIRNNRIKNAGGGRWLNMSTAFNQAVNPNNAQFNKVTGAGNEISCNLVLNEEGKSKTEDILTTYQSQGTSSNPILIQNNCVKGGGPSPSGGGIMIGDGGGVNITAQNNTLINVGQYSLAIAGGHNNKILNNKIHVSHRPGYPIDVGLYVVDYGNSLGSGCGGHTVQGNQIDCISSGGHNCGAATNGSCGNIAGWANNDWGGAPGSTQYGPNLSNLSCPFDF